MNLLRLNGLILVFILTLQTNNALALDKSSKYQLHTRMGLFSGSYAGSAVNTTPWSVPTTIDVEIELFQSRTEAYALRATMAMELDTNIVQYTYAGVGKTNYIGSRGRKDFKTESRIQIKNTPKLRYYWGWNAGVAQVAAENLNLVASIYSTTLDFSANTGLIYQTGENLGFETRFGMGFGYGFSSVTVTGTTIRLLFGLTYFY